MYKIYALEYLRRNSNTRDLYLRDTKHQEIEMSYYFWVIQNDDLIVVVDTGVSEPVGVKRDRKPIRKPEELLARIGIQPDQVDHLILTHLHFDHANNLELFPNATVYLQESELSFWLSSQSQYPIFKDVVELDDILEIVRRLYSGKVVLTGENQTIFPGIVLHKTGGHTPGLQIVEVDSVKGKAVIASDAVKTFENYRKSLPDPFLTDIPSVLKGYEKIKKILGSSSHMFPGHDARIMEKYRAVSDGIVVLD
jgi:glyoxylase-like metal-dependent hydrolase (beta-lactamase superfamily II)